MIIYKNNSVNPYYNQALEEFLLNQTDDDVIIIWQNNNAIVVGKHQNALAEINYEFTYLNKIDVVRRLSGGGTVFHDLGNVNFTFIKKYNEKNPSIDFKKFLTPILNFLNELGLDAQFSGRNDILIDNKKISGNAEHIFHKQKKILHHGTLLFNSNLEFLKMALKGNSENYKDKAVKSVKSKVTNISKYLSKPITTLDFIDMIVKYLKNDNHNCKELLLSENEIKSIENIANQKYCTWQWNYAYSPKYEFKKTSNLLDKIIEIELKVEKGIIYKVNLNCDILTQTEIKDFEKSLCSTEHRFESFLTYIKNSKNSYLNKLNESELLQVFF